jgi:hypothetical protein
MYMGVRDKHDMDGHQPVILLSAILRGTNEFRGTFTTVALRQHTRTRPDGRTVRFQAEHT